MRFLVDAQLPPGLVGWLVARGCSAEHVFDRFPPGVSDDEIWRYALLVGAVIVSKDDDFARRVQTDERAPQVVWVRVGNTGNRVLYEWLSAIWPHIERSVSAGERLIEVV